MLNSPSDGRERAVSTALMLQYYGVYAPPPLEAVVSPNGDGVAETQKLSYKVVRPSTVTATLTAPDGTVAWQEAGEREPGHVRRRVSAARRRLHRKGSRFRRRPSPLRRPRAAGRSPCPRPTTRVSRRRRRGDSPSTRRSRSLRVAPARGRRPEGRREGRNPLVAGPRGAREGDGRDAGGHRRAHRVERPAPAGRADGGLGRPRRQSQAGRRRTLRRPRRRRRTSSASSR